MNTQFIALAFLTVGSLHALPQTASAAEPCSLRTIQAPTQFPIRSQLRGQRGIVLIQVSVDQDGHATDTQVVKSSGYRLLDRAATHSIRKNWVFDTRGCERKDLPATRTVAVEYHNDEFGL